MPTIDEGPVRTETCSWLPVAVLALCRHLVSQGPVRTPKHKAVVTYQTIFGRDEITPKVVCYLTERACEAVTRGVPVS